MATIRNSKDSILSAATYRLNYISNDFVLISGATNTITTTASGTSPTSIVLTANLNGNLRGTVVWTGGISTVDSTNGNKLTIQSGEILAGATATVTATLTYLNRTYTDSYTISHIAEGLVTRLSKSVVTINTASDGSGGDYTLATSTMTVQIGTTDDSTNWTYAWTIPATVSATGADTRTITVSGMSVDSAELVCTASKTGYVNQVQRFTVSKIKAGAPGTNGTNGTNGADAVNIDLAVPSNIIAAANNGTGYTLPTGNSIRLYKGGVLLSSGVTYGPVTTTKNGLTLAVDASTGAITLSGTTPTWTSDAESFTLTAVYNSITYSTTYSIAKSKAGNTAQYVQVTGQQSFKYLPNQSTPTDTSITLTANTYNITSPTYLWQYWNGTAWANLSGTNNASTYALVHDNAAWGTATVLRIKCTVGSVADEITINKLYDGTVVTVNLTNSTHELDTDATGAVNSYVGSGTTFDVNIGTTKVTTYGVANISTVARATNVSTIVTTAAHGLTTGNIVTIACSNTSFNATNTTVTIVNSTTFTYANTGVNLTTTSATGTVTMVSGTGTLPRYVVGTPTITPAASITVGTNTSGVVADHSAMTSDTVTISYPITIYKTDGTSVTLNTVQSLIKNYRAASVSISAVTNTFIYAANGTTPNPTNTVVTAVARNVNNPFYRFLVSGTEVQGKGTTATYTFTPEASLTNMPKSVTVEVYASALATTILASNTLAMGATRIGDKGDQGNTGTGGISVVLSKPVHVFPASQSGAVGTYTGSGTTISVYEGGTKLSYQSSTTTNGEWYIVSSTGTNITPGAASDAGQDATIADHSGVTAATDTSSITYSITGKTLAGVTFTLTAAQSFSKAKTGVRVGSFSKIDEPTSTQATLDAYTSTQLTTKFTSSINAAGPVTNDVLTITGSSGAIKSWLYDSTATTWSAATARFDGAVVVDGTIRAKAINVDNLSAISANLGEVTAAKISTTGNTQTITLADTTNDTNIINVFSRDGTAVGKPLTSILNYGLDTDCSLSIDDYSINKIEDIVPNDVYYDANFNFSTSVNSVRGGIYANGQSGTKVPSIYARGSHNGPQLAVDAIISPPTVTTGAGIWLSSATATPILSGTSYFVFTRDSANGINGFLRDLEKNYIGFNATSAANSAINNGVVLHVSPAIDILAANYDISTTTIKFKTPIITKDYSGSKLVAKQNLVGVSSATISSINTTTINIGNNDAFKTNGRIFEFWYGGSPTSLVTNTAQHPNSLTKYYVVNQTATSFQIALSLGGAALTLTNPGGSPSGFVTEQASITAITAEESSQYCTITNGSTTVGVTSTTGLVVGQYITSASGGIPANTTITAIGTSSITISAAATTSKTVKLIFNYIITTSASLANSNYISVVPYAVIKKSAPATDSSITDLTLTSRKSTTYRLQQHGLRVRGIDPQSSGTSTLEKAYTYEWKSRTYGSYVSTDSTYYSSSVYLGSTDGNAITLEKGHLVPSVANDTACTIGTITQQFNAVHSRGLFNNDTSRNMVIESLSATKDMVLSVTSGRAVLPNLTNAITLGTSSYLWSTVYAASGVVTTSDVRQKIDVQPSDLGLSFINSLNPVKYKFKNITGTTTDADGNVVDISQTFVRTHYGLIAQEVKQSLPQNLDFAGWILSDKDNPDSSQGLRYTEFIGPMIKAIQELSQQVVQLQAEIDSLKSNK